jgi:hypothetical protein
MTREEGPWPTDPTDSSDPTDPTELTDPIELTEPTLPRLRPP